MQGTKLGLFVVAPKTSRNAARTSKPDKLKRTSCHQLLSLPASFFNGRPHPVSMGHLLLQAAVQIRNCLRSASAENVASMPPQLSTSRQAGMLWRLLVSISLRSKEATIGQLVRHCSGLVTLFGPPSLYPLPPCPNVIPCKWVVSI